MYEKKKKKKKIQCMRNTSEAYITIFSICNDTGVNCYKKYIVLRIYFTIV